MISDVKIKFGDYELTKYMDLTSAPDFELLPSISYNYTNIANTFRSDSLSYNSELREIELEFVAFTKKFKSFRDELNEALNTYDGGKQSTQKLTFSFFEDRYWNARVEGQTSFKRDFEDINKIYVQIRFVIPDGVAHASFKRKYPAAINENGALEAVIYNNGTTAVPIDYYINHRHENGFVGAVSQYGAIQVGNEQETDKGILPSKTIIDVKASDKTLDALPSGGGTFTQNEFGTDGAWEHMQNGNRHFIKLNQANTGKLISTWHGASKRMNLLDSNGDGLSDFTVDLRVFFLNSNAQQKGLMQFLLVDGTGTKKVGFSLDKGLSGNNAKLRLHTGELEGFIDFDTGANDLVDYDHGQVMIEKTGNTLTFRFANRTVRYVVQSIEKTKFTSINLLSATLGKSDAMPRLCWERLKVIKHYTDKNADIPNRFAEGSQVFIEGKTSKVYYNGVQIPDANGSKYFKAPPGETKVEFYYSDFSTPIPEITCEIEEAWL
ncbi:hypothetical protein IGK74_002401 [Enterococcus sp. AZ150]|uniref:hypothetical protein n=1 Tax=Enterococcus sp. AZ150 TaxID=2774866 RepID=UPI003F21E5D9